MSNNDFDPGTYNVPFWNIPKSAYPTYVASGYALTSSSTPALVSTGEFFTLCGSATKTVCILYYFMSGTSTNNAITHVRGIKRLSANSGGTRASLTRVSNDSDDDAATAIPYVYSVVPTTLGTSAGNIFSGTVATSAVTPSGGVPLYATVQFPGAPATPLILHGTDECFSVSTSDTWPSGYKININVVWCEI